MFINNVIKFLNEEIGLSNEELNLTTEKGATNVVVFQNYLDKLDAREEKLIRLHFGLDEDEYLSFEELSTKFNVPKERMEQIYNSGIQKLKKMYSENKDIDNMEIKQKVDLFIHGNKPVKSKEDFVGVIVNAVSLYQKVDEDIVKQDYHTQTGERLDMMSKELHKENDIDGERYLFSYTLDEMPLYKDNCCHVCFTYCEDGILSIHTGFEIIGKEQDIKKDILLLQKEDEKDLYRNIDFHLDNGKDFGYMKLRIEIDAKNLCYDDLSRITLLFMAEFTEDKLFDKYLGKYIKSNKILT